MTLNDYKAHIGLSITLDKPYGKIISQAEKDNDITMSEFVELTRYAYEVLDEKRRGWRDE